MVGFAETQFRAEQRMLDRQIPFAASCAVNGEGGLYSLQWRKAPRDEFVWLLKIAVGSPKWRGETLKVDVEVPNAIPELL